MRKINLLLEKSKRNKSTIKASNHRPPTHDLSGIATELFPESNILIGMYKHDLWKPDRCIPKG